MHVDLATVTPTRSQRPAAPALPPLEKTPYRIAEVASGRGPQLVCGEPVAVRVTIWDLHGKELFSNRKDEKPLAFTPGCGQVMLGLEQGVIGMQAGGTRLLIVPPAFQSALSGTKPATLDLQKAARAP